MLSSRLTQKYQATIPSEVRKHLHLTAGDQVGFEVNGNLVTLKRLSPLDLDYLRALEGTLSEWNSDDDETAYHDL